MPFTISTLCACKGETHDIDVCPYLTAGEVAELYELGDWLDDPPVSTDDMAEGVDKLLSVAWFITEEAIRYNTGQCSSTATRKDRHAPETIAFTCQCCRYFASLDTPLTRHIRRSL